MEREKYPLKLKPVLKETIWGGIKLKQKFGKLCDFDRLAESWELTVREREMNVIENGPYTGMPLGDYLGAEDFPLLVKLIDANDKLSIQVHPDDTYARREGELGKTEMWYVLEAEPDAKLVYGLKPDVPIASLAEAIHSERLEEKLHYVPVSPGDVFFIPAGLVHAIGSGILLAEIQQNSDVTYRVYDYGRKGLDGKPRELHVKKALDVIRNYSQAEIDAIRFSRQAQRPGLLAACDYFTVEKLDVMGNLELDASDGFRHLLCLSGEGSLSDEPVRAGDSYLLPAGRSYRIQPKGPMCLLLTRC